MGRFDELRQGGGVEWKNPSENPHFDLGLIWDGSMNCDRGAALNGKTKARIKKEGAQWGPTKLVGARWGPDWEGVIINMNSDNSDPGFSARDYKVIFPPA